MDPTLVQSQAIVVAVLPIMVDCGFSSANVFVSVAIVIRLVVSVGHGMVGERGRSRTMANRSLTSPRCIIFDFVRRPFVFFWQGVIPKYSEMLDEMTTGTCVALEVSARKTKAQSHHH